MSSCYGLLLGITDAGREVHPLLYRLPVLYRMLCCVVCCAVSYALLCGMQDTDVYLKIMGNTIKVIETHTQTVMLSQSLQGIRLWGVSSHDQ